jgi:hypothetical protein
VPDNGVSVERIDDLRAALLSSRPPTGILSE